MANKLYAMELLTEEVAKDVVPIRRNGCGF